MRRVCRFVVSAFFVLYLLALAIFLVGVFGLFGQEQDPLSAVFLLPLGLPWIYFVDAIPGSARAWVAAATPVLNLIILAGLCRAFSGRRA